MKKLIFVGAQGTGKTTVLNKFKEKGFDAITEVVRNLSKDGVKINQDGNIEGQKRIFDKYLELFDEYKDKQYVSDRGLIDVAAYTFYHYQTEVSNEMLQLFMDQYNKILEFNDKYTDILYVYFPIEFPVVDDGVRDMDEDFRTTIDGIINIIVNESKLNVIKVTGTVEERVAQIEQALEDKPKKKTRRAGKKHKKSKINSETDANEKLQNDIGDLEEDKKKKEKPTRKKKKDVDKIV